MPGFMVKSSVADPEMTWLTVNRQVSTSAAMQIWKILEADRLRDGDRK